MNQGSNSLTKSLSILKSEDNPLFKRKMKDKSLMTKRIKKNEQFSSIIKNISKQKQNQRFRNILSTADLLKLNTPVLKQLKKQCTNLYLS